MHLATYVGYTLHDRAGTLDKWVWPSIENECRDAAGYFSRSQEQEYKYRPRYRLEADSEVQLYTSAIAIIMSISTD